MQKNKKIKFNEKYIISLLSLYAEKNELISQYKKYNFEQLGINSLGFVKLLVDLEKKYKIEFSGKELMPNYYRNLQHLIDLIKSKTENLADNIIKKEIRKEKLDTLRMTLD